MHMEVKGRWRSRPGLHASILIHFELKLLSPEKKQPLYSRDYRSLRREFAAELFGPSPHLYLSSRQARIEITKRHLR